MQTTGPCQLFVKALLATQGVPLTQNLSFEHPSVVQIMLSSFGVFCHSSNCAVWLGSDEPGEAYDTAVSNLLCHRIGIQG